MSHDKSKGVWLGGKLDMNYYSAAIKGSLVPLIQDWDTGIEVKELFIGIRIKILCIAQEFLLNPFIRWGLKMMRIDMMTKVQNYLIK